MKIAFYSPVRGHSGMSTSLSALATRMCLNYNMKTLVTHAELEDRSIYFNWFKPLKKKTLDETGLEVTERLSKAGRLTGEFIKNYSFEIIPNRLSLLSTVEPSITFKNERILDVFKVGEEYFEIIFIECSEKGEKTDKILAEADLVVVNLSQNYLQVNKFINSELLSILELNKNVLFNIGKYTINSKVNSKLIRKDVKITLAKHKVKFMPHVFVTPYDENLIDKINTNRLKDYLFLTGNMDNMLNKELDKFVNFIFEKGDINVEERFQPLKKSNFFDSILKPSTPNKTNG